MQYTFNADVYYKDAQNPSQHIIAFLQVGQWCTIVITDVVFLNRCDLFLVILVSTNQIVAKENFSFEMFCKKGVLKHFVKITGKYLCQRLFCNKVSDLLQHSYFPAKFAKFKFFKNFFIEDLWWLLLSNQSKLKENKKRTHNSKINQKESKTPTRNSR